MRRVALAEWPPIWPSAQLLLRPGRQTFPSRRFHPYLSQTTRNQLGTLRPPPGRLSIRPAPENAARLELPKASPPEELLGVTPEQVTLAFVQHSALGRQRRR